MCVSMSPDEKSLITQAEDGGGESLASVGEKCSFYKTVLVFLSRCCA